MRLVLAPNAFKGSFGAVEVAEIWVAALAGRPGLELAVVPMSDGGDGFAEVVRRHRPGALEVAARVRDARGRPCPAAWTWDPADDVAYVESARAIGLARLAPAERDPLAASSAGLAGLLRAAAAVGPREIVVGLGGSATVDGGWGLAAALGFGFLAEGGGAVERPADLARLAGIEPPAAPPLPAGIRLRALADVTSPLLGPTGAAAAFGPQKGADPAVVERLERALGRLAERWTADLGAPRDLAARRGAGAAGGLGAGLAAFLDAALEPGAPAVARLAGLEAALERAEGVVTGEGRYDDHSATGKATGAVVAAARERGLPVVVICGAAALRPSDPGVTVLDVGELAARPAGGSETAEPAGWLGAPELAELAERAAERLAAAARPTGRPGQRAPGGAPRERP